MAPRSALTAHWLSNTGRRIIGASAGEPDSDAFADAGSKGRSATSTMTVSPCSRRAGMSASAPRAHPPSGRRPPPAAGVERPIGWQAANSAQCPCKTAKICRRPSFQWTFREVAAPATAAGPASNAARSSTSAPARRRSEQLPHHAKPNAKSASSSDPRAFETW